MKTRGLFTFYLALLLFPAITPAATLYVNVNNATPAAPYTNWLTAATTIQDAVDAASPLDEIIVTNGIYATGGRAIAGAMTNRVTIDKPVVVRSVNGPRYTEIWGYQVPGTLTGDGAIRCAYVSAAATLSGFKLTKGATRTNGNTYSEKSGGGVWCVINGKVSNCIITGNVAAEKGGGAYSGMLYGCAIYGNSAYQGGGAVGDLASFQKSQMNNCTIVGNTAQGSGGVFQVEANNCIIYFNHAGNTDDNGGGNNDFIRNSCITPTPLKGAENITVDPQLAGIAHLTASSPCRQAGNPLYAIGTDIDGEPWASPPSMGCDEYSPGAIPDDLNVTLSLDYTNVAAGFPVTLAASIDGFASYSVWDFADGTSATNGPFSGRIFASHSWNTPGTYNATFRAYNSSLPSGVAVSQSLQVIVPPVYYVAPASPTPTPPFASWATAAQTIQDAVDAAESLPGAVILVTNGIYSTGGRAMVGTMTNRVAVYKPFNVRSVNGPQFTMIQGKQLPGPTNGNGAIRCVYLTNGASLSGFTLTGGATRLGLSDPSQFSGGGLLCETGNVRASNCIITANLANYSGAGVFWGKLFDCIISSNKVTGELFSGSGGVVGADLNNCLITGNSAYDTGGAGGGNLTNCTISFNTAVENGGGATAGNYFNCLIRSNRAAFGGGVIYGKLMSGCTVVGNIAQDGGGLFSPSKVYNSIIYYNSATVTSNYSSSPAFYNCCTLPAIGTGNLTNAPLFINAATGNFRLQTNSPCINAGNNDYAGSLVDFDGRPRVVGGTVDIGAYEFQGPGIGEFTAWLQSYQLPADGSADFADSDGEGMNNWKEWISGTVPINALSVLKVTSIANGAPGIAITWQSVTTRSYSIERTTSLVAPVVWTPVATSLPGQPGTTSYTDSTAATDGTYFYRVGVQP